MTTQTQESTSDKRDRPAVYSLRLCVDLTCPPPPPSSYEHKGFGKRKLRNTVGNVFTRISSFHGSCSWFPLYPTWDCVTLQQIQSPSSRLHFNQSIYFIPKCWGESHYYNMNTKMLFEHHQQLWKFRFTLIKRVLPFPPVCIKFLRKVSG